MYRFSILFFFVLYLIHPEQMYADENIYNERLALYKKTEAISNLPWYYLAAFDQYERNKEQNNNELVAISFPDELWYGDRKSTRLNSSHVAISYAVFCLKKKKQKINTTFSRYVKTTIRD